MQGGLNPPHGDMKGLRLGCLGQLLRNRLSDAWPLASGVGVRWIAEGGSRPSEVKPILEIRTCETDRFMHWRR